VEDLEMTAWKWVIAGWLIGAVVVPAAVRADDFRVDTELFENQAKEPFLQTLTIFSEGTIYDFRLTEPAETTVFDSRRGRFTLLDESRRVQAAVTTQELLDFCLSLETHAAQEKDRLFSFCAVPKFDITDKPLERNGQSLTELRLSARPLVYVAVGQNPQKPDVVKAYRQFTDWCARLNATRPGNLPPGARLSLNQALADLELIPLEITRTIPATGPLGKKLEIRSEHRANWSLSGEDKKRIDRASDMLATFQTVSYLEYCHPPKTSTAKQAKK
jgi:hypothetical protein